MRPTVVQGGLTALIATLIFGTATNSLLAGSYSFTPLGDLPGGDYRSRVTNVSADGAVVVGFGTTANGLTAFRWTKESGMVSLRTLPGTNNSIAFGVSADGSVVVGQSRTGNSWDPYQAFRWTQAGGMVALGYLHEENKYTEAVAVSADGSVVIGTSGLEIFRWTEGGGMVGLGVFPSAGNSLAWDVSADGLVVVGRGVNAGSRPEALRWTEATGMVGLGHLYGGQYSSEAFATSADGSIVVGNSSTVVSDADYGEAFRWTENGGMVGLGDLPGGQFYSSAKDVSADGSVIVGTSGTSNVGQQRAFVWTESTGMVNLRDLLVAGGATGLNGWALTNGQAVSADGRTIGGYGRNPAGNIEAWIATIPEPPSFLLAGMGLASIVAVCRRGRPTQRTGP